MLHSLNGSRGDVELRSVDRQKADKLLKRGLTLEYIFNHSDEDVQKEFEGIESAVENLIGEITSRVKLTNMDDFLEYSVYSDKKFILLLKNFSFGFKDLGMMFWDLESEVVNVGDYMVSQNFASILRTKGNKGGLLLYY